jgi:hypothetical protein
MKKTTTTPG